MFDSTIQVVWLRCALHLQVLVGDCSVRRHTHTSALTHTNLLFAHSLARTYCVITLQPTEVIAGYGRPERNKNPM